MPDVARVAVIMAGGSGERFWPLSRRLRPKQLLRLADPERTLLAQTVDRLLPLTPKERIFVATGRHLQQAVRDAGLGLPPKNVLAEPCKRDTAGCLAYAAAQMMRRFKGDVSMAVVGSDYMIGDAARYAATLKAALEAVESEEALATIGIPPTRPATGFGYIEVPENAHPVAGSGADLPVYPVAAFREKPTEAQAEEFLRTGRFFWNSGMFFWRLSVFMQELTAASPAHAKAVRAMAAALAQGDEAKVDAVFESLPDISIDFALMEKAKRVLVARGDFPWDDIGSWDALDRTMPHDPSGNVAVGAPVVMDGKNCIVYNAPGASKMTVAVLGCRDLIVVAAEDALLVLPKSRAQDVKKIVAELRERGAGAGLAD